MLEIRENKRNDLYIFLARRDVRKLTCLAAKFQEGLREPSPGELLAHEEHSSFRAVKKCWKNFVGLHYCRCYADFVSASLFNQIIMFTVSSIGVGGTSAIYIFMVPLTLFNEAP